MAADDRTDPLARYTGTGSRTSSMPANPYKSKGQNAYWNGTRWVPFTGTSALPTVAKTQDAVNAGNANWWTRNLIQPVASVAAAPFSRSAARDVGSFWGNQISRVPGLRDVIGSQTGGVAASVLPTLYGTSYLQNAAEAAQAGKYAEAAKQYGMFGGNLYLTGQVGGPATKAATAAAKTGGVRAALPAFLQSARGYTVPQTLLAGLNVAGSALQAQDILSGQALARALPAAETQTLPADRAAELAARTQSQTALDYLRTPQYQTSPYGSTIKQTFTDAEGRVHNWNPRSKMYEVTGTVAPGTTATGAAPILGLSAAQQLEFENRLRDIEAETKAVLSGLGGQAASARSQAKEGREESRRQVAGGSQDIASGLAFLGLDTSPGVLDVAKEYQARAGAEREAGIAKSLAETISGISSRSAEARRRQEQQKRDLAAARLQLEEENIRKEQENALRNIILGGGK